MTARRSDEDGAPCADEYSDRYASSRHRTVLGEASAADHDEVALAFCRTVENGGIGLSAEEQGLFHDAVRSRIRGQASRLLVDLASQFSKASADALLTRVRSRGISARVGLPCRLDVHERKVTTRSHQRDRCERSALARLTEVGRDQHPCWEHVLMRRHDKHGRIDGIRCSQNGPRMSPLRGTTRAGREQYEARSSPSYLVRKHCCEGSERAIRAPVDSPPKGLMKPPLRSSS